MPLAQSSNLCLADACAPLQPLANRRLKLLKMPGVNARCLPSLDGSENLERVRPPSSIDPRGSQAKRFQRLRSCVQAVDDLDFAIVKKAVRDSRKTSEVSRLPVGNLICEKAAKQRRVRKIT